jgi:hypothetical protein
MLPIFPDLILKCANKAIPRFQMIPGNFNFPAWIDGENKPLWATNA